MHTGCKGTKVKANQQKKKQTNKQTNKQEKKRKEKQNTRNSWRKDDDYRQKSRPTTPMRDYRPMKQKTRSAGQS